MSNRLMMVLLLIGLVIVAVLSPRVDRGVDMQASAKGHLLWNGLLFGIPLILAGFLAAGVRWAFMAGVMFGTIGLALDIATVVQDLTNPDAQRAILPILWTTSLTGVLNCLLILIGGRGLLDVGSIGTPQGGRPP
ncbi:MAG: hypothetical protein ACREIL_05330, partial [Nitrospiraceae bacterium]